MLTALIGAAFLASPAGAAYGDGYDIADVNVPGAQQAPAYPGSKAFWAGTCQIATAPPIGEPIPGGVGSRPSTIADSTPPYGSVPAPEVPAHCIDWGTPNNVCTNFFGGCSPPFTDPTTDPWASAPFGEAPSWRLAPDAQAGGHPDGTVAFAVARSVPSTLLDPDGTPDNVVVDLPRGFVGNPTALPKCSAEDFAVEPVRCSPASQVGVANLALRNEASGTLNNGVYPVYNLEPRAGRVAEFGIPDVGGLTSVRILAKARTNSDFGVSALVAQIPAALPLYQQMVTFWGVPWDPSHDTWRPAEGFRITDIPYSGLPPEERVGYDPAWGEVRPFLSNVARCDGLEPQTGLSIDTFQHPGALTPEGDPDLDDPDWIHYEAPADPIERCDAPGFDPDISIEPTVDVADSATGLDVNLTIPQNEVAPFAAPDLGASEAAVDEYLEDAGDHWRSDAGLATAHLDEATVTLPAGVSVNPSGAAGLLGCTDAGVGLRAPGNPPLFNNGDPFDGDAADGAECPSGSIIGAATVDTPLLDEPLTGHVVLGQPKSTDPQSGEMFRLFLVVRSPERGLIAKVYGSAVADPLTGRITTTFAKNPQIPFRSLRLSLKDGPRGLLAMPQRCGSHGWSSSFTPWTAFGGGGGLAVSDEGAFAVTAGCAHGFAPSLAAGMDNATAGGGGTFTFKFTRSDGQQWFRGVTAELPPGLLAAVKGVPLCTNAQANGNACPASSRIGVVDAGAGSGAPLFLEKKGSAFLTEGYKGAPYGLAVSVPVEAGPFRGALALRTIVVRQALHVDRADASVTAVSDPFPTIWHGIPLRVRQVTVRVDRPGFMRNPTDCSTHRVAAKLTSTEGATATPSQPFGVTRCRDLGFAPKLALRLTGRRQTTTKRHPGVRAVVTQQAGEAGIERVEVRLPSALALDPDNAQALCEYADGIKDEPACPKGSIVGRARAVSPLLDRPLVGNVYFVKNVRRDPVTGALRRTLPMIVVALRGEIAINLRGESGVKRGRLVNTFNSLPDAPISRFNLNLKGGKRGIVVVTGSRRGALSICGRQVAEADIDGHNGRRADRDVRVKTPCSKGSKRRRSS